MSFYRLVWTLALLVYITVICAQSSDSLLYAPAVDSVTIITTVGQGMKVAQDDNAAANENVTSLLDRQTTMTIRSGGPGLIATALRRGMASRHMAILWNGFNIQSAVNGTYDLSLLPRTFLQVSLLSHEKSTAIGNASVAGALSLKSSPLQTAKDLMAGLSFGSDGNLDLLARSTIRQGRYAHAIAFDGALHNNRYDYRFGNQTLTQDAASFDKLNVTYDGQVQLSSRMILKGGAWIQHADREIPPSKTSSNAMQLQTDDNRRTYMMMQYGGGNGGLWIARAAYAAEYIYFRGGGIDSKADVDVLDAAVDYISGSGLKVSVQHRSDRVDASFFLDTPVRTTQGLMIAYDMDVYGMVFSGSVRPQIVDGALQPLAYHLRAGYTQSDDWSIVAHHGRGFTLPALNDLYWPSGGNPDLQVETSYMNDVTIRYTQAATSVSASLYHNTIDNWIQWIPIGGIFQPVNQRQVINTGVDLSVKHMVLSSDGVDLGTHVNYAYLRSRLSKHYYDPSLVGKSTIFVPAHKANLGMFLRFGAWRAGIDVKYYGQRFDTVDNSDAVAGYAVGDVSFSYATAIGGHTLTSSVQVDNVWNTDYEHIRFFPMPLRLFRLGFAIQFSNNKKQE